MRYTNGDEFLSIGTVEELAKKYNVKKKTIYFLASPTQRRRVKYNGKVAVRINE